MKKVVVGMSGGVDSAVAALLLKRQGYDVTGIFMKNWEETDENGVCAATQDYEDVKAVCAQIGVSHYTVNFSRQYYDRVFNDFLDAYKRGVTPNPDVMCNREIKFDLFKQYAKGLGADYLATGHFARVGEGPDGKARLYKGADNAKDQSYFLCMLSSDQLKDVIFPVGELTKQQVREIALENGLKVAKKKDSTGVCFIGERNFKEFLKGYIPAQKGDIVSISGETVGTHDGVMYYTIGQRKGLGIGGGGSGDPWFVVDKDVKNNVLIVSQGEDSVLFTGSLTARDASFIAGGPPGESFEASAKIRYRQPCQPCHVTVTGEGELRVEFADPQRAVTPGQVLALYSGDECLGGAIIVK